jgi:hypothetical protein
MMLKVLNFGVHVILKDSVSIRVIFLADSLYCVSISISEVKLTMICA